MLPIYTNGTPLTHVFNLAEFGTTNQRKFLPTGAYVTQL